MGPWGPEGTMGREMGTQMGTGGAMGMGTGGDMGT